MGRRYDHDREELRRMALAAARAIVAHDGVAGLSARRIAEEIGYSPGTLYNLFANLDAIILALNAETLDALHSRLEAAVGDGSDPRADIAALARAYVGFTRTHLPFWEMLLEHRLPPGQSRPDWYRPKIDRLLALLDRRFLALFPPDEAASARRAARILWAGLQGICTLTLSRELDIFQPYAPERLADELADTFLGGVAVRHGPRT